MPTHNVSKEERIVVLDLSKTQEQASWDAYVTIPVVRAIRSEYLRCLNADELDEWIWYLHHVQDMSTYHISTRLSLTQPYITKRLQELDKHRKLPEPGREYPQTGKGIIPTPSIVDISARLLEEESCFECKEELEERLRTIEEQDGILSEQRKLIDEQNKVIKALEEQLISLQTRIKKGQY